MNAERSTPLARFLPIALIGGALVFALLTAGDDPGPPPSSVEPVEIDAVAPVFETADEMAEASDLVVDATVVDVTDGRVVTDPDDTDRGIRTRLVRLEVSSTLSGVVPDVVIVEQEAALLDGTPIVVDGIAPFEVGERAIWFLVRDPTGDTDYFAVINDQGRVPVP